MKASRFSDVQKAFILKQGADGMPVADICRKAGISQATYFNWKKILLVDPTASINATLYEKLNYNFIRDIAPVAGIVLLPQVMVVNPSFPAKTVPELIAYSKANPGKVNMASPGIATPGHVAGELFKMMAGVDMVPVPYRGGAPALTDLISGQVQV